MTAYAGAETHPRTLSLKVGDKPALLLAAQALWWTDCPLAVAESQLLLWQVICERQSLSVHTYCTSTSSSSATASPLPCRLEGLPKLLAFKLREGCSLALSCLAWPCSATSSKLRPICARMTKATAVRLRSIAGTVHACRTSIFEGDSNHHDAHRLKSKTFRKIDCGRVKSARALS